MNIDRVIYGRTIGGENFSSERFGVEATPADDQSADECLFELKALVDTWVDADSTPPKKPAKAQSKGRATKAPAKPKASKRQTPLPFDVDLPDDADTWLAGDWADYIDESVSEADQLLAVFDAACEISTEYDNAKNWAAICETFSDALRDRADSDDPVREQFVEILDEEKARLDGKAKRAKAKRKAA